MGYPGNAKWTARPTLAVFLRYGLAVTSAAAALGTTLILRHYNSPPRFISHFTMIAIAITFWYAGPGPGLLALLLSGLGVTLLARSHFLLPSFPLGSFLMFYGIFSLLVGWFSALRRRAERLLTEARNTLELRVAERTGELTKANEQLQNTQAELGRREAYLAEAQRLSHTGSFSWSVLSGEIVWSDETFRIFEYDLTATVNWELVLKRIHPDDRNLVQQTLDRASNEGTDFDLEQRLLMPDGSVKHIHVLARALKTSPGNVEFVGAVTDVTAAKQAEEGLRRSESYLAEAQRLTHTGSWAWRIAGSAFLHLSEEWYRIYGFDPEKGPPAFEERLQRTHPEDRAKWQRAIDRAIAEKSDYDEEIRILLPGGTVKYIHIVGHPVLNASGDLVQFVGSSMDISTSKRAERKLRRSEECLLEAQRLSHTGSWQHDVVSGVVTVSPEIHQIFGSSPDEDTSNAEFWFNRIHPEDRKRVQERIERSKIQKTDYRSEHRIVLPHGAIKYIHVMGHPVLNQSGDLIEFVGSSMDVTEAKKAEAKIRQSERELRQLLDLTPLHITEFGPDGSPLYNNQAALDYHDITLEQWKSADLDSLLHPQDAQCVKSEGPSKFLSGSPFEMEARLRRRDGRYRWFLFRFNPIRDEQGRLTRWYAAATDIEDRKQAEERLQNENVVLREEIDKASMFEEIIGTSPVLQAVLSRVSKVAPTDSTVLVSGETGTGKELVARAIHRRSQRASRAFVSVNCAAIPRDLIASELFGHEKGAFTGATQQRLGRFELAKGGTIFLDEVGELPAETQIALLRVLQEHEFERVGGTRSIQTDVRVIAATNRDLQGTIDAGTFRSDLFYRLNVFPVEIPPLRGRREDIPLLVGYFIDHFARKAGKSFCGINKKTLDLLLSYSWPGNIRELQNVIERSVIVCETENFLVDESWLSRQPLATEANSRVALYENLPSQEKAIIETALSGSGGRVFGPSGAAAKLGMPRSTLESKIRSLKIDKKRFKPVDPSKNN
jgi:PAS domain S-box-containing protein